MPDERKFADAESLRPAVSSAFGRNRSLLRIERLAGGSKKGAYRLMLDDGGMALVCARDESEDYWRGVLPEGADDPADPFSHASGLALFDAAARRLASAGVRCPEILFADRSRALHPADIAVVEYVPGGSLEALLEKDPVAAERPLAVLADWLAAWLPSSLRRSARWPSSTPAAVLPERRAIGSCSTMRWPSSRRSRGVTGARPVPSAASRRRCTRWPSRSASALVHGELGPDHVLLDRRGEPVLIDIEGAKYFDVETEHVWTRMRFGEHYAQLSQGGLDEDRLRFYQLCMHLDLVAGPLRIAGTSHPEREWFRNLAEHHLQRALQFPS
jgi:hypothetical protein